MCTKYSKVAVLALRTKRGELQWWRIYCPLSRISSPLTRNRKTSFQKMHLGLVCTSFASHLRHVCASFDSHVKMCVHFSTGISCTRVKLKRFISCSWCIIPLLFCNHPPTLPPSSLPPFPPSLPPSLPSSLPPFLPPYLPFSLPPSVPPSLSVPKTSWKRVDTNCKPQISTEWALHYRSLLLHVYTCAVGSSHEWNKMDNYFSI